MREPGFYWIHWADGSGDVEPFIAELRICNYNKGDVEEWFATGEEDVFESKDVTIVSERLVPP
jgi:hypothetical protein